MESQRISIGNTFSQMLTTLQYSWLNLVLFEIACKVLVLVLFKPLISATISFFAKIGGFSSIINGQVGEFLTSLAGIGMIVLLVPLGAAMIYYEFAVIFIFLYGGFQKKKLSFLYGLKKGISSLKSLYHKSSLGLIFYALCLIPSLQLPIYSSLLPDFQIPEFITGEILKYPGGAYAIDLCRYLPAIVYIVLCFVIPVMVLEQLNFHRSLKRNFHVLKGNLFRTVFTLLLTFACWDLPFRLLHTTDNTTPPLLFTSAGVLIDLLQIISTPLFLAAVLVCFMPKSKIVEIDDDTVTENSFLKKFWEKCMPAVVKRHPALLLVLLIIPVMINTSPNYRYDEPCLIIGHRGSVEGVENSIQAVLGAAEQKADYAEIDILLSADNVPMVIHDDNLFRLSGKMSSVHGLTADELQDTLLKQDGFQANIPTLDAMCKAVKGKTKLLVELKSHGHEKVSVVDEVMDVLTENGIEQSSIFHTSEYDLVEEMKKKYPDFNVGYIVTSSIGDISTQLPRYKSADFYSVEFSDVTEELVTACHKDEKPVYAWTSNDEGSIMFLLDLPIDGVITDFPKEVRQTMLNLLPQ